MLEHVCSNFLKGTLGKETPPRKGENPEQYLTCHCNKYRGMFLLLHLNLSGMCLRSGRFQRFEGLREGSHYTNIVCKKEV